MKYGWAFDFLFNQNAFHGDYSHTAGHWISGWWFQIFLNFKHQEFAIKSLFLHLLNACDMSAQRCLYHLVVLIFSDFLAIFSSDLDKNWERYARKKKSKTQGWKLPTHFVPDYEQVQTWKYLPEREYLWTIIGNIFRIFENYLKLPLSCFVWSCLGYTGVPYNQNKTKQISQQKLSQ